MAEEAGGHVTEKLWSLTLEIIFMLRGEEFPAGKSRDHVTITVTPPPSLTPERRTLRKILEVANKITELLTGETGFSEDFYIKDEIKEEDWEDREMSDLCEGRSISRCGPEAELSGDGVAAEEASDELWIKEEEEEVSSDGQYLRSDPESLESEIKDELASEPKGGISVPTPLPPDHHNVLQPPAPAVVCVLQCSLPVVCLPPQNGDLTQTTEKPFSCSQCGKTFSAKSSLIIHERVHTGEKPYSCSECGKCFSQSYGLIRHKKVHTREKPYTCSDCGKCFAERSTLITHGIVHTEQGLYSCAECGKQFATRSFLIRHERVHTGEKPYSCPECGKCFATKSTLVVHERLHTGEKPYSCSTCGKGFTVKSALIHHERAHTGMMPYLCSECGKGFSRKPDLINHMRVHTGQRPYSCSVCGKCFTTKSTLIRHKGVHTRVRPYSNSSTGRFLVNNLNLTGQENRSDCGQQAAGTSEVVEGALPQVVMCPSSSALGDEDCKPVDGPGSVQRIIVDG